MKKNLTDSQVSVDLNELAPMGYRFLLDSSHEQDSANMRASARSWFSERIGELRKQFNRDYTTPSAKSVKLPDETVVFEDSMIANLLARQSTREFNGVPIPISKLGFLLKLASGIKPHNLNGRSQNEILRLSRFYPSGGGLYATRIYVDALNVEGLPLGIWRYNPLKHSLDLVNEAPIDRDRLYNCNIKSLGSESPSCVLLVSIKPKISVLKYKEHAWRVLLMEVGHLSQNVLLVATGLGLVGYLQSSLSIREAQRALRVSVETELLIQSIALGPLEHSREAE